jgi:hypothetical protein
MTNDLANTDDGWNDALRKAARELTMAIYVIAHKMLRQEAETLVITRTAAVGMLMRAMADAMRSITLAFAQALTV